MKEDSKTFSRYTWLLIIGSVLYGIVFGMYLYKTIGNKDVRSIVSSLSLIVASLIMIHTNLRYTKKIQSIYKKLN